MLSRVGIVGSLDSGSDISLFLASYAGATTFDPILSEVGVGVLGPDLAVYAGGVANDPTVSGNVSVDLASYVGATAFDPSFASVTVDITFALAVYGSSSAFAPVFSGNVIFGLATFAGATANDPTFSQIQQITELDAWLDNGTSVSLASPGSRTISAGDDRLFLAHPTSAAGSSVLITGLSWGGQAMTLVDEETSTGGRDLHSSVWRLDEAGIDAASGTAFIVTPNSGSTQFRIRSATYENVDQVSPVVGSFAVSSVNAGDDPISSELVTINGGKAVAATAINRGTSDAGTEDISYSNMTEQVEENASTSQYSSVADTDVDGTGFTPGVTSTQTGGRVHLIGVSLRPVASNAVNFGLVSYVGATVFPPVVSGNVSLDLATFIGATAFAPVVSGNVEIGLATYVGATVFDPTLVEVGGLSLDLAAYVGGTAFVPVISGEIDPNLATYVGGVAFDPAFVSSVGAISFDLAAYVGATASDPVFEGNIDFATATYVGATVLDPVFGGGIEFGLASYVGATVFAPTLSGDIDFDLAIYAGATVSDPEFSGSVDFGLASYIGATAFDPTLAASTGTISLDQAVYAGATVSAPVLSGNIEIALAVYIGGTAFSPTFADDVGAITLDLATYVGATVSNPTISGEIDLGLATYAGATVHSPTVAAVVAASPPTLGNRSFSQNSVSGTNARVRTLSHNNNGTGSLIVWAICHDSGRTHTTVTVAAEYDGVAMTELFRSESNNGMRDDIPLIVAFELASPASGTNDVEITWTPTASSGSNRLEADVVIAQSLSGDDGVGANVLRDTSDANSNGLSGSLTLTEAESRVMTVGTAQGGDQLVFGGGLGLDNGFTELEHDNSGNDDIEPDFTFILGTDTFTTSGSITTGFSIPEADDASMLSIELLGA